MHATVFLLQGSRRARVGGAARQSQHHRQRRHGLAAGHAGARHQPALRTRRAHAASRRCSCGRASVQLGTARRLRRAAAVAEYIDTSLAPDGAVTALNGRDNVRVTIPAICRAPAARAVAAPLVNGVGEAGPRPDRDDLRKWRRVPRGGVEGDAPARVARARTLKAAMSRRLARSTRRDFSEGFRFEDGKIVATSADAAYQITKGTLALEAPTGRVAARRGRTGRRSMPQSIDVTLSPRAAERRRQGVGTVRRRTPQGERGHHAAERERSRCGHSRQVRV